MMSSRRYTFLVALLVGLLAWALSGQRGIGMAIFLALAAPILARQYVAYAKRNPKGLWFKSKLYGWGWMPVRWQGWAVVGVYLLAIIKIFLAIDATSHSNSDTLIAFSLPFIILTTILIVICYVKGEWPHWQWGEK